MLLCYRDASDAEQQTAVRLACCSITDWELFLLIIQQHGMTWQVYQTLQSYAADRVPAFVLSKLKKHCQTNQMQSIRQLNELIRLSALFRHANISILSLKGPLLALDCYGEIAARESMDIDMLVSPQYIEQAHQIILQQGYRRIHPALFLSPKQYTFYLKTRKDFGYWHPSLHIYLELHWRLFDNPALFKLDITGLLKKSLIHPKLGLLTLPDNLNLLYLFTHGSVHAWSKLKWLCDIYQIIQQRSTDWPELIHHARQLNVLNPLLEGMVLLKQLFHCPVPPEIKTLIKQNHAIQSLVAYTIDGLYNARKPSILRQFGRAWRLNHSGQYRLALVKQHLCILPADWRTISLPDNIFFVYHFLRPVLWFGRKLRQN